MGHCRGLSRHPPCRPLRVSGSPSKEGAPGQNCPPAPHPPWDIIARLSEPRPPQQNSLTGSAQCPCWGQARALFETPGVSGQAYFEDP